MLLGIGIGAIIVYSIVKQAPTIEVKLDAAWADIQKALKNTSVPQSRSTRIKSGVQDLAKNAASGLAGTLVDLVGGVASLIFGLFISLNILVWVLIQGRKLGQAGRRKRMGPVPPPVAYDILANSARFFRGYIYGSTLVGLFNGGVMFVGALIIGVPLAATIGIVGWFTNYIPFFGAIISGAFAVLIALGSGGPSKAIPMLIIVIISNGYLQTLISQFALGSALKLHPLAVLFATTAGSAAVRRRGRRSSRRRSSRSSSTPASSSRRPGCSEPALGAGNHRRRRQRTAGRRRPARRATRPCLAREARRPPGLLLSGPRGERLPAQRAVLTW